jgi:putative ABC transport system ATP-binding protein
MEQARRHSAEAPGAVISLRGLAFGWDDTAPLLDISAFDLAAGERLFLRGPSGSGKSTLLGLLGGVLEPQAGTMSVLGQDLTRLSGRERDRFRADHLGIIFQMFNLLPYLSVIENVVLPCRFSPVRAARAGGHAGFFTEAERLVKALGLEAEHIGRPVTQLSVGQQQRVAAARALIGRPELIIADEPTSALDADRRTAFIDLLMEECAANGASLVFVSHDRTLGPAFDRVVDLDEINQAGGGRA